MQSVCEQGLVEPKSECGSMTDGGHCHDEVWCGTEAGAEYTKTTSGQSELCD